ncbi:MAG: magnesium/cobalt transporter CorA [Chloroflexi bacterium]|nr:magnesium/cobalt transporter CorA [Chloroflexota bacterium]
MIRVLHCQEQAICETGLTLAEVTAVLQSGQGMMWLDMWGESPAESEAVLHDIFHFHPLAIDDALNETHAPKLDDWGDYLYIVLHAIQYNPPDNLDIHLPEVDIFVGRSYLVTYHQQAIAPLERVWAASQTDGRIRKYGISRLLYRLADELMNEHITAVEKIEEELEAIEDEIFNNPDHETLEQLFIQKRRVLQMRRTIGPQRAVFNSLSRNHHAVIDLEAQVFFSDIYDHMIRLYDLMDSLRELSTYSLSTYLSIVNNRMNNVMKTMAIVTALFLPLTFITGFFGMNFFAPTVNTDVWTGWVSFFLMLVTMLLLPFGMFWYIRRRRWL